MSDSGSTGVVLVAGFCLFLTGASFWKPAAYEQELPAALRAMAQDRKRLRWIQSWMCVGVTVTTLGVALLGALLWTRGERVLSILGVGLFAVGAVLWLAALFFRYTVEDWAAGQTVQIGEVPDGFEAWERWAGALHSFHMVSAYLSWALIGGSLITTAVVPIWLGWSGVALGVLLSLGFVALKGGPLSPPILAHVFPLAVGIALLV